MRNPKTGQQLKADLDSLVETGDVIKHKLLVSCWREIRACNDNACGESKSQNSHDSLLDLTCLIAATDPKAPID